MSPVSLPLFLGLVLGSFATALAYRLPRDLSIVTLKRSRCSSCGKALGVLDLVPLFSWLFLKGKCRYCHARIGKQYPAIELATLGLCLIFYAVYGLKPETFLLLVLAPIMTSLIDIDLQHKIIPDGLNLSILLIGVAALFINAALNSQPISFLIEKGELAAAGLALYCMVALAMRYGAKVVLNRESLGLGDVKFYAAVGFWLGLNPDAAALFMVISGFFGVVFSTIWKKRTGDIETPFGPALVIAFIATLCFYPPAFIHT